MKVVIYARVSTEEQYADKQVVELKAFVARRGDELVKVYTDVVSGSKDSRPGLNDLVQDAFQRKFDAVVVWKLDRLGRSLKHLIDLVHKFESWSVALVFVSQQIDTTTPQGKLFFHIFGAISEFERELISERTILGMKGAKNVGKRGRDKTPRKFRSDKGKKRGGSKKV